MRRVFGFGETVLDIIFKDGEPVAAKPGGSVLNAFVSLGRLGWDPCFVSEYARDEAGERIEKYLVENGVDTRYVNRFTEGKSALALAFLDDQNNARYSFYKDFPKKRLQALPREMGEGDIVLFGSIYASTPEVRDAVLRFLRMAKEQKALIIYDPNFRKAHLPELQRLKPMILENFEYADIIRGSDEDFSLIFGIDDPQTLSSRIDTGSKILIYTENHKGARVFYRSHQLHVPAEKIVPVSTIGAGDNFNAGIVHYLLKAQIRREQLGKIQSGQLHEMAFTGIRFATHVCLHYDNYISWDYAREARHIQFPPGEFPSE
jgi:fructokinase